jgi:hypothetical protein
LENPSRTIESTHDTYLNNCRYENGEAKMTTEEESVAASSITLTDRGMITSTSNTIPSVRIDLKKEYQVVGCQMPNVPTQHISCATSTSGTITVNSEASAAEKPPAPRRSPGAARMAPRGRIFQLKRNWNWNSNSKELVKFPIEFDSLTSLYAAR